MTIADLKHFPSEVTRTLDLVLELKAHALVVIDLRGISTATDFFVLASGNSDVQVRAIAEHVVDELKLQGARPGHVEGMQGGRWVLLDYINFVVHVFHPEARTFYQLEDLWGDAPRWDVSPES
ncbi:MAG TPA: ribosome silencing factor [Gemmatimonadetes bacterium]|jgi:ribosome-associated protein|nr:ribosome silencing factor [Gemmatimonadota bacterium]HIB08618.1 ribosome silencing factor [Gemmatimonadota bacterium]HIC13748.1 ribosome silencing factor [Gemmatimonadota bacterium]HIN79411.1 ribosome silencing factor [Gemmatimonadota bacterium]